MLRGLSGGQGQAANVRGLRRGHKHQSAWAKRLIALGLFD